MKRKLVLPLILASSLVLGGCAASLAASALGAAVQSARGEPQSNEHLRPEAVEGCRAHASQYGAVRVIDVEQRNTSKIVVWGTVENDKQRQSFECAFGTRVTGFKLRRIASLR